MDVLEKLKREMKPRSQMVRQIRATGAFIFVLQALCLFVCVGFFLMHARGEIEKSTEYTAKSCAEAIREVDPTDCVREIVRICQKGENLTELVFNERAISAIVRTSTYQEMLALVKEFHTEDVYLVSLVAYDETNDETIIIAESDQEEGDSSYVGAILDIPDELEAKLLNQQEYASYTLFTPTKDIVAMSAQYLVEGDPAAGILYVASTNTEIVDNTFAFVMQYAAIMLAVLIFMLYYLHTRTMRLLVSPLDTITEAIKGYSKDRSSGDYKRRHFAALGIETNNELENLSTTLAKMELDEATFVDEMAQMTAAKEREEAELRMAARIQESALPSAAGAFPDRPEFEIFASMTPAKEVGGDFFDFFLVDDDHLCMVMADVSDKGIPAALFMMKSKTTIALHIMMGKTPAQALKDANLYLCENNQTCMFVTVWVGVLEISTGKLVASNAAHEYPVLSRPHGRFALYRDRHGIMVGARKRAAFSDYRMVLRPGSKLFVYTDGVPEATNAEGQMFGLDRMVDALNEARDATPEEILAHMKQSVDDFVQDASQFDDLTMLCLEYKGPRT